MVASVVGYYCVYFKKSAPKMFKNVHEKKIVIISRLLKFSSNCFEKLYVHQNVRNENNWNKIRTTRLLRFYKGIILKAKTNEIKNLLYKSTPRTTKILSRIE